jgi:hypothetical protein
MTPTSRSALFRLGLLVPAALVALAPGLRAQAPEEEADLGESPERYAQVKVLDGEATIRKGDLDEPLTRGTPVAEGDVVESRGRGVLQLGDGTRVAFGPGTRFRVAALFADREGTREVLLRLDAGSLRVRVGSQSDAKVRVDTPAGTGFVNDTADAAFEVDRDGLLRFRVHAGRCTFANDQGHALVRAGERLTVRGSQDTLDRLSDFNTYEANPFDQWAEPYLLARRSKSAARVPQELRPFVDDLDDNGRWSYVEEVGTWCWSPMGMAEDWRPYYDGRWAAYPGGMTWISAEPWGYVTCHHGRWGWGAGRGWYWIPGVFYSPAWVAWQSNSGFFGWAPLGYTNRPCAWGYGAWGGGPCWNVVGFNDVNGRNLRAHVSHDPRILGGFNHGGPAGPWFRGRMPITSGEFRDPVQIQRVAAQRDLVRTRMATYEQGARAATGRIILRREPLPAHVPGSPRPFEGDRPRAAERPLFRERPVTPAQAGAPEGRPRRDERPEAPRERPRLEERRPEPPRLRIDERRPEPVREVPRLEFRPSREAPRQEAPRQEQRPASPPHQDRSPAPAPRQEAPRQEAHPARETPKEH